MINPCWFNKKTTKTQLKLLQGKTNTREPNLRGMLPTKSPQRDLAKLLVPFFIFEPKWYPVVIMTYHGCTLHEEPRGFATTLSNVVGTSILDLATKKT